MIFFLVKYNRICRIERVGENEIGIGVTVRFLWTKRSNREKPGLHRAAAQVTGYCLPTPGRSFPRLSAARQPLMGDCLLCFRCVLSELRFLCSCVFFTHFRVELAFGVNMKVVDN
jgi:hypothetical protein